MPKVKKQKSARAKRADQKTISIAEIKNDTTLRKRLLDSFRALKANLKEDFAGTYGLKRLEESARRAKMTPWGYFVEKLAPKL